MKARSFQVASLTMALVVPACAQIKTPETMRAYEQDRQSERGEAVAERYPEMTQKAAHHHRMALKARDDREPELVSHSAKVSNLWWEAAMRRSHADDLATETTRLEEELTVAQGNLADAEKQEQLAVAATGGSAARDAINTALAALKEAERVDAPQHAKEKFAEAESKLDEATSALREGKEDVAQSLAAEAEAAAVSARAEAEPKFAETQSDSELNAAQLALFKRLTGIPGATAAIVEGGVLVTIIGSFESAGVDIKPDTQTTYDKIVEAATDNNFALVITGHTDTKGRASKNLQLSNSRAQSVMGYLAQRGIAPGRMTALGKGSGQPVADNKSKEGRARNRRIEIFFVGTGA